MNRLIRGPVVLAVALAALSCKGDPTDSLRNGVDQLLADPGALFIRPDSTKTIIVGAVDEQGNQIQVHWSVSAVSAGLTVVADPGYNLIYDADGHLVKPAEATREQFLVTATGTFGGLSFNVSGGGKTLTIPVRILPSAFPATFSTSTPASQDTVTITAGAGALFDPAAVVRFGGVPALIIDRAVDGTSISFVPVPGSASGPATVEVVIDYLGTLALPSDVSLTVPPELTATSFASAPDLALPGAGSTATYVDGGAYAGDAECTGNLGGPCRIFKFTVAASSSLTFNLTWDGTTDLGGYFYDSTPAFIGFGGCDAKGNHENGQPETCTRTFAAGTYYLVLDDFGAFYAPAEAEPTWQRIDITVN